MVQQGSLRSGALAKAASVSPDTIRHYEKIGVLPKAARTQGGYRVYPESAVERVLVVQRALRIGFSLAELAEVLKARDAGGAPCRRVIEIAQKKLETIKAGIKAMKLTERYLEKTLSDWKTKMLRAGPGQRAHLLHSLTTAIKSSGDMTHRLRRKNR
jgi:DNA-binding transcriptional MerR regulator